MEQLIQQQSLRRGVFKSQNSLKLCGRRGAHDLLCCKLCLMTCLYASVLPPPNHSICLKFTLLLKTFTYRAKSQILSRPLDLSWPGSHHSPLVSRLSSCTPLWLTPFLLEYTMFFGISVPLQLLVYREGRPFSNWPAPASSPRPALVPCFHVSLNTSLTLGSSTWEMLPIRLFPQLLTPPALAGLSPAQLLDGWVSAFPDAALFSLHSLWAGCASKLRFHLDHPGSNHMAFPARLVTFGPLGPLGELTGNGWQDTDGHECISCLK